MKQPVLRKTIKTTLWSLLVIFILTNVIGILQAYNFTHFYKDGERFDPNKQFSTLQKLRMIVAGPKNLRAENTSVPPHHYTTINIKSNVNLECWYIKTAKPAKGTVILFHGYMAMKSRLIVRAEPFLQNGYNCLLVDFMGSGGSEGNNTTIGYKEAWEVADCYNYIKQLGEKNIYLYGTSMGAVAVMKAISDGRVQPKAIVIESPFATMYETVAIRFRVVNLPPFPLAHILLFWGGVENGFWAHGNNPVDYAKNIHCPVLLQYGEQDIRVDRSEIDRIYHNLNQPKQLITYPLAGHSDNVFKYPTEWSNNVVHFLDANN